MTLSKKTAAFIALATLGFAALNLSGCGPGFPIMTREQEALTNNVETLLKENDALKKRLAAIEARESAGNTKKDFEEVKRSLADVTNEMEKLRQEFSFVQGAIETSDHDKGQVRDSLKAINASLASVNERAASIEAAMKEAARRDDALRVSVEANEKMVAGFQESILSLDKRTVALEGRPAAAQPSKKTAKAKPEDVYAAGHKAIKSKDFAKAVELFSSIVDDYPGHKLAGNAAYWIGEAHYAKGDFEKAALEFDRAIKKYPESEKTPAAMLKEGFSLDRLGMKKEARALLEEVAEKYPRTQEAKKAKDRLKELKQP